MMTLPPAIKIVSIIYEPRQQSLADKLALCLYYMSEHFTHYARTRFTPHRRCTSQRARDADITIHLHFNRAEETQSAWSLSNQHTDDDTCKGYFSISHRQSEAADTATTLSFENPQHLLYLVLEQLWLSVHSTITPLPIAHDETHLQMGSALQLCLNDLPFIKNNPNYSELCETLHTLLQRQAFIPELPPADMQRIAELRLSIQEELSEVFYHSLRFAELRTGFVTERMQRAISDFDRGALESALARLESVEEEAQLALDSYRQRGVILTTEKNSLQAHAKALHLKAQLLRSSKELCEADIIERCYPIYELLLTMASLLDAPAEQLIALHRSAASLLAAARPEVAEEHKKRIDNLQVCSDA